MSDFFAGGNVDPDLEKIYGKLCLRADRLLNKIDLHCKTLDNPFYRRMDSDTKGHYILDLEELRNRLEDFVVDLTMLDLEDNEAAKQEKRKQIFARHHDFRKILFAQIFLTPEIDDDCAKALVNIMTLSSIDPIDAQLMVTALMLSCSNMFDGKKADVLFDVYSNSQNEELSQRALVSYIISVSSAGKDYDLGKNPLSPSLLAQVQQQLLYTMDSPRVEQIMQREIMPDIIKNSEFDFQNNRIIPRQKDKLDEILNPHKDDEMIEKMEETMNKMKKLQEQGSDLFFGGFRYVKNHPFFSDVINWFCPFYFDHPQLPLFSNEDDRRITSKLITRTPFCDSDKYSFVISMHKAIGTIPDEMKKMLKTGEAQLDIVGGGDVIHNAAFIRRTYLQDIFRFFKICSWAGSLKNVLESKDNMLISNFISQQTSDYDAAAISVVKCLRKFSNSQKQMQELLNTWEPSTKEGKIFKAFNLMAIDIEYSLQAQEILLDVLADDPHNIQALFGITKTSFHAIESRDSWMPYKDEVINSLLALYFKNEKDMGVLHTLIKAYLLAGDLDKAIQYANEAMDKKAAEPFVISFLALMSLENGDTNQAISLFRKSGESIMEIGRKAESYGIPCSKAKLDILMNIL